ncbi:hypothetical protein Tco_0319077 [Tanacetum coccineum]
MNATQAQQKALDDARVSPADRLEFGKCNMRLQTDIKPKEATFQVVMDALALTHFYQAFLITAEVPAIYMQEFWATVSVHKSSIRFTINKKKFSLDVEIFREILQICPKIPRQEFDDLPLEHDILSFIKDLGHSGDIIYLTDVSVDYLHQPWRAFATIINKCLSGKETGMDKIRLSRAQIFWGVFYKKNIDYVYLLWEDFLFQIENKEAKKTNKMSYPRFTKIIIDYFMSKDQSILKRNKMFWHTARDDTMFTSMRCISRHEKTQKTPKPKYVRKKADSNTSPKQKPVQATKGTRLKTSAKVAKSDKKKQPANMPKAKGLDVLSKVALTEAEQLKLATKRSKTQFHSSHTGGSGDGVDTQSKVPDEQQQKVTGTNEGAGVIPEVPNVPKYDSDSEEESWTFSQDDEDNEEVSDKNDDSEETESDNDGDDLTHPNLSTYEEEEDDLYRDLNINLERSDAEMTDAQANQDTEDTHVTLTTVPPVVQQKSSSVSSDLVSKFINIYLDTGIDSILNQNTQSDTLVDVPVFVAVETPSSVTTIPQQHIPNIQPLQQTPNSTTTTTTNPTMTLPEIPNFASLFQFDQRVSTLETEMSEFRQTSQFAEAVSSIPSIVDTYLASKMKEAVDVAVQLQSNKLKEKAQAENQEFLNQVDSTMKAIIKEQVQAQVSKIMPQIEKYVTESLGAKVLVRSTNQAQISDILKDLYNALVQSYNTDKDIITSYGDVVTLKRGRDDQDKDEDPSAGSNQGASKSQPKSSGKSAHAEEHDQKVADLEDQPHQEFNIGNEDVSPVRETLNEDEWHRNPSRPPTPNREWHKTKTVDNRPPQPWITQMAQAAGTQSSFNEFFATPIDFSGFIMHRLKIENLTQEVLTSPTYDLIKGTCKSIAELEYHLEEVFQATNDRLDNPEGKPYPHDLSKPLHLILNEQGRQVIPLDHFINNDLEYLKGGSSSQKYTTSITKTKTADYGQVKWIEDKVFR